MIRRLPGLDLLRAIAIVWVMLFHSYIVGGLGERFAMLESYGWMGVDLFFVLSGYLIGSQLLRPLSRGEPLAFGNFYLRRSLRVPAAAADRFGGGRLGNVVVPRSHRLVAEHRRLSLALSRPGVAGRSGSRHAELAGPVAHTRREMTGAGFLQPVPDPQGGVPSGRRGTARPAAEPGSAYIHHLRGGESAGWGSVVLRRRATVPAPARAAAQRE